ncbi:MAG: diguanylate cyclase [Gammaproteobacteria bacterium]|nr:diguanylate cyclase [Gammaproteobacteria bacterium]MBU1491795.1 diguanylate cyclase [Gammaproteobacteria bacterium]MBU2064525.1 diguanylate cyclase [Gammaproteobacteria bacterium]MBU2138712.1 diguanylate cyclase [Gammaproteobacteria bacterium]MBU2214911.1 diguanylate cyclase [Gammaproteobacteria bacterium]
MHTWLPLLNRRPKLLVVDDQPTNIRVLHQLFREECDLFMATNGEQALGQCRSQQPDLVLLDVIMDGLDGHEVCRRLKADPLTADIPVIFITAQQQETDEETGLTLGAVDFISKPINPAIVRARVRTHLTLKLQSDLLRAMALNDGLTGVANRRKFDEELTRTWRHCLRERMPLSLIMIDVDFFKRYNDYYGHPAGDACLRAVAQALAQQIGRPNDLLARYGGEEFACLLPATDHAGACLTAQNLLAAVEALSIEHQASEIRPHVSLSLGVVTAIPTPTGSEAELIAAADAQLYEAKKAGRARYCAAQLPELGD